MQHILDTDSVFQFSRQRFSNFLPKIDKVVARSHKKLSAKKFDIHTLIELEKARDVRDLKMLLQATFIDVSERKVMLDDLINICKMKELNIRIPGYADFNPAKPDLTQDIPNFFPTVI